MKTKLEINLKNDIKVKQVVKIERSLVIVAYFILEVLIIVQGDILSNRDYIFKSILFDTYFYVIDRDMSFVYVCNNRLTSFYIL